MKALLPVLLFFSCSNINPEEIVSESIKAHGGDLWKNSNVSFNFRSKHYDIKNKNGFYEYKESYTDSGNKYLNIFNNNEFLHYRNDSLIPIKADLVRKFSERINSIVYFASLPSKLSDKAVIKKYMGEGKIKGTGYYKIEVTFKKEGGGTDYKDRFIYWINKQSFIIDYFAYRFHINGGGSRFRKRINTRVVSDIVLSDYENYKSRKEVLDIAEYEKLMNSNSLEIVSNINLENVHVSRLKK